jgi:hypothetical protein
MENHGSVMESSNCQLTKIVTVQLDTETVGEMAGILSLTAGIAD